MLILAVLVLVVVGFLVFAGASRSSQTRNVGRRARRVGLGVFFGSVAVNAGLGIYAVLTPHFGDTAGTILATSLCVTGAILMALVCEPAWERRLLTPVPVAGAALGAAAFAGLIVGLWTEPESATLGRLLASTFAAAIGCTLSSVIVLERERKGISLRHRRAIIATLGVIAFDVAVAVAVIWIPSGGPGSVQSNLIGTGVFATVACILVDLLTLLHPARPTQRVIDLTLGLIVLAATVAVVLVWADVSGHTAGKFAGTCLIAAAACILAGVLTLFHPAPPTQRVLTVTLGLVALAATVAVALIWTEASGHTAGKFAGTCGVAAAACILAALLTHARLAPAHRWVLTTTLTLLALGAVLASADIWLQTWGLTRAMGVVLIALAAFVVTVPVVHRLDRSVVAVATAADDAIRHCPHCGRKLSGEAGVEIRCERCERAFTVIDSERGGADAPMALGRLGPGRPADRSRRSRERKNVSQDVRAR